MSSAPAQSTSSSNQPALDAKRLAKALGHISRWKILRELSRGEPREIAELATAAGCSYDSAIKHLGVLRRAGLVVQGRGRLFQIQKHHLSSQGECMVDYGHCVLRLGAIE